MGPGETQCQGCQAEGPSSSFTVSVHSSRHWPLAEPDHKVNSQKLVLTLKQLLSSSTDQT